MTIVLTSSPPTAVGTNIVGATPGTLLDVDGNGNLASGPPTAQEVTIPNPTQGQGPIYNGSGWIPDTRTVSAGAVVRAEMNQAGTVLSNGTDTGVNYDEALWVPVNAKQIRLLYMNYLPDTTHGEDYSTTAQYTITAAVVAPGAVKVTPVTFGGKRTLTLDPGGFAFSDPIQVNLVGPPMAAAGGDLFRVRTFLTVPSGGKWVPVQSLQSGAMVDQVQGGTTQTDLTITGGVSGTYGYPYGPAGVFIDNLSRNTLRIFGIGDSILAGSGDNVPIVNNTSTWTASGAGTELYYLHQGWFTRAFAGQNVIGQRAGIAGDKAANYAGASIPGSQGMQARLAAMSQGANAAMACFGTNDLATSGQTLAGLQSLLMPLWADIGARDGMRAVYVHTLSPAGVTSTDNWATIANQTISTGGNAIRIVYNSWLRDGAPMLNGSPVAAGTSYGIAARCTVYSTTGTLVTAASGPTGHLLAGIFDFAATCEVNSSNVLTPNGGYWIVNGTSQYATIDGTHPSSVTHTAFAAAVPLAAIRSYVGVTG